MTSNLKEAFIKFGVAMALIYISGGLTETLACQNAGSERKQSSKCLPDCGSSAISGSFVPAGEVSWTNASETSGEIVWMQPGSPPSTFVMDLLYEELPPKTDYSVASARCARDQDMPVSCRIGNGKSCICIDSVCISP